MIEEKMIKAAKKLASETQRLTFSTPTSFVYNPLVYAWEGHETYLKTYGTGTKKVVFLGMNPGPWGMAQTGIPFGEIVAVKEWLGIEATVSKPENEHSRRPVNGFSCLRSEVSGRRLWGLFKKRYKDAHVFFKDYFVTNYCPLIFMETSGRNRTPDKLKAEERRKLYEICDEHLQEVVKLLQPQWVIGIGRFSETRARKALAGLAVKVALILHPSPASPAANRDWAGTVTCQLKDLGIWKC